jgi:hypothetical protein
MSLETEVEHLITKRLDKELGPLRARIKRLEWDMTSAQSAQDALATDVAQIQTDITSVADELNALIQANQAGQLTADQVNAALVPLHQQLTALVTPAAPTPTPAPDPTPAPIPDPAPVDPTPGPPTPVAELPTPNNVSHSASGFQEEL